MKPLTKILIILGAMIGLLLLVIIGTRIIPEPPWTWWITIGLIILYVVSGLIAGIIFLILKGRTSTEKPIRIAPKDALAKLEHDIKWSKHNPDNFVIVEYDIRRVGAADAEKTPILWARGFGHELKQNIDGLINLNNEKEKIILFAKTESYVLEVIRTFAENPETIETKETILGTDEWGRPTTRVVTRKGTKQELEERKLEEQKAVSEAF